VNDFLKFPIN